jgi:hypothetical protein
LRSVGPRPRRSAGYIQSPEGLWLDESVQRLTASAINGRPLGTDGPWATTAVFDGNKLTTNGSFSSRALFESEAILDRSNTVLGRAEYVRKSAERTPRRDTTVRLPTLARVRRRPGLISGTSASWSLCAELRWVRRNGHRERRSIVAEQHLMELGTGRRHALHSGAAQPTLRANMSGMGGMTDGSRP